MHHRTNLGRFLITTFLPGEKPLVAQELQKWMDTSYNLFQSAPYSGHQQNYHAEEPN